MAFVLANRVQETTTTTGTGSVTLAGAVPGFQSFAAIGNANNTYYTIAGGSQWEVGIGTYTAAGTTLSRDTVLSSSAGGTTKVTFSAGTKNVFVSLPTERTVYSGNTTSLAIPAPGTLGNILTSDGIAWTSATPTPSSGTVTAVASGALSDGTKVTLNSDGTVSAIAATVATASVGDLIAMRAAGSNYSLFNSCYIAATAQVVLIYGDGNNLNYMTTVVGNITGTRIAFGSPQVLISGNTTSTAIAYDPVNAVLVLGGRTSTFGERVFVGVLSGNSITVGTIYTPNVWPTSACYDPTSGTVLLVGRDTGGNNYPAACVVRVTGSSLTIGTGVTVTSVVTYVPVNCLVAGATPVMLYSDANTGAYNAVTVTISGTTVTFGTPASVATAGAASVRTLVGAYDTVAGRFCVACYNGTNVIGRVGTVSGSTISFGTAAIIASGVISQFMSATYDAGAGRILITYYDSNVLSRLRVAQGTISGTSITFATPVTVSTGAIASVGTTTWYDFNAGTCAVAYMDSGGTPTVATIKNFTTNLSANFLGIANAAYSNGQTATIQTAGSVDDAQSGLVTGQQYYVQYNGALNTARTPYYAGTALSSARILIKG